MTNRTLVAFSTVLAVACLAAPALAGQPASAGRAPEGSPAPRTPWGAPDLQGVWSHATVTPLERPERHEGREFLTAEEIAEANIQATTFASSERRAELSPERDVGLAYNQFWWDRGLSDGRTSLIVDPPDGRIPPGPPEWPKRRAEGQTPCTRLAAEAPLRPRLVHIGGSLWTRAVR